MELQRLSDMSSHIGEQIVSSRNGSAQNAMMAQYARDMLMLNSRKIYYGGERNCGCAIVDKLQERSHYNYIDIDIADIDANALKATPSSPRSIQLRTSIAEPELGIGILTRA
eukprot:scaffold15782_cov89-Skeletonema_dohrnii-CCMP3373.AAC.1